MKHGPHCRDKNCQGGKQCFGYSASFAVAKAQFIGGPLDGQEREVRADSDRIVMPIAQPGGFGQISYARMSGHKNCFMLMHDCALARGMAYCAECGLRSFREKRG